MKNLKFACQYAQYSGVPRRRTQLVIVLELILERYATVVKSPEWIPFIEHFGRLAEEHHKDDTLEQSYDDLAKWIESGEGQEERGTCGARPPPMNRGRVELYMCSYCRNPSAVLRKCGGCGKAR